MDSPRFIPKSVVPKSVVKKSVDVDQPTEAFTFLSFARESFHYLKANAYLLFA